MSIYWKISKKSETGKKLVSLLKEVDAIRSKAKIICDEFEVRKYRIPSFCIAGIESVLFESEPDRKIWKYYDKKEKLYSPRKSTPKGRELFKRFEECGKIRKDALDKIVGNEEFIYSVGFQQFDECFVITSREEWHDNPKFNLTADCDEIKWSEFKKLEDSQSEDEEV